MIEVRNPILLNDSLIPAERLSPTKVSLTLQMCGVSEC